MLDPYDDGILDLPIVKSEILKGSASKLPHSEYVDQSNVEKGQSPNTSFRLSKISKNE
jgi:hypothetical protein